MAILTRSPQILDQVRASLDQGLAAREIKRALVQRYRMDYLEADDYVRIARVQEVRSGLTACEQRELAETASIQFEGWLARAVRWLTERLIAPIRHRHPDSLPRR